MAITTTSESVKKMGGTTKIRKDSIEKEKVEIRNSWDEKEACRVGIQFFSCQ
jgi:hypothetical protein